MQQARNKSQSLCYVSHRCLEKERHTDESGSSRVQCDAEKRHGAVQEAADKLPSNIKPALQHLKSQQVTKWTEGILDSGRIGI